MNIIIKYLQETFKIFLTLIALFLMIATGLGSILLIAYGLMANWRLFFLGLFLLSALIAFLNIYDNKERKN